MKVASVSILCQDERVFSAMEMAGTPCPYQGKIGKEASKAWKENRQDRPDYEQLKDKYIKHCKTTRNGKGKENQEEPVQMSSMPQTKSVWQQLLELSAALTVSISLLLLSLNLTATYIYEGNQGLIDLTGVSGTTSLAVGDDRVSNAFNLGFTFDYYGQSFTQARVATNGCLHFKTSGAYCNDYTPDPLTGQHTYTLYPFGQT